MYVHVHTYVPEFYLYVHVPDSAFFSACCSAVRDEGGGIAAESGL